jgi:hypothetical protein
MGQFISVNQELIDELVALRRDVTALQVENAQLRIESTQLRLENTALRSTISNMQERMESLDAACNDIMRQMVSSEKEIEKLHNRENRMIQDRARMRQEQNAEMQELFDQLAAAAPIPM